MINLAVLVNEQLTLQYNRTVDLPDQQAAYLNKLDAKFDGGIELQGEKLDNPDIQQRAKFMALSMMEGIMYQEDSKAAASLAWLATRLPELKQVVATVNEEGTQFQLIFDKEYEPQQVVKFDGLKLNS